MFELKLDTLPIEQLENDLDRFGEHALPYAVRDSLNTMAFKTADLGKKKADQLFTMRNTFAKRSIRFQKTFKRRIDDMESAAGSTEEFMARQVEGFTETKRGKHGVPLPTSAAAGQDGANPRTRVISRRNWINRLQMAKARRRAKSRGQEVVQAVQQAIATKQRDVFLRLRTPGIYRVLGGRQTSRGWPAGARLRLLYSLEHSTLTTRPHDWLGPPTRFVIGRIGDYYREALIRQIEKQRIFRDRG